ncbi:MAG TPA: alginate lyase family protein [Pyrinomonadaceae bacterium]|nr:alginate lyase family protein [Pyrinomonadaceae bacterium]
MSITRRIKSALRGEVSVAAAVLESARRARVALARQRERANLTNNTEGIRPACLSSEFAKLSATALLEHFRARTRPRFFPGFYDAANMCHAPHSPETIEVIERARGIVDAHRWPLLGYGVQDFGAEIDWLREPVSNKVFDARDYHSDVVLARGDDADARVLWELNRLGHLVTLARAYVVTGDAPLAREFFAQIESWRKQNPTGRGANWSCTMEVALRAMNLLAAFEMFRRAPELDEKKLSTLLAMFEGHGAFIRRNLEFSYIATSNHYLSDVVGLLWLGVCLPELQQARVWREFALREMLREMDKQVHADGADCESSTGYHRFVLELFLYSFVLCRANGISIPEHYWQKLRAMLEYARAYLRPGGRAPLVGDSDGGQALSIAPRAADDHSYVLAVGAGLFNEARFKVSDKAPEEVRWILGGDGVEAYENLADDVSPPTSAAFPDAGTYVMREGDLYLLFNASGAGLGGRGSHGHNDALSIEVSACGAAFITDPGTFVYSADLRARHLFRSTAYHSTIEVDGTEQNTTDETTPFIIGDEAHPRVLKWESDTESDLIVAEHRGYRRLKSGPITHRRACLFNKRERYWVIEDALTGEGHHDFRFRFHVAPGLQIDVRPDSVTELCDKITGARLLIAPVDLSESPAIEPRSTSRGYGAKVASSSLCWTVRARAPLVTAWIVLPVCGQEDEAARLQLLSLLRNRDQMLEASYALTSDL